MIKVLAAMGGSGASHLLLRKIRVKSEAKRS